ncbi:MAG: hypothetical protein J6B72_05865 [Clostridia bacterium]|nr:hypothetical protein [Clostridia bacterium]
MKDHKHNINYFKRGDSLKSAGLGMAVVGLILLWMGWGYLSYILTCILLPTGLVLFFVGSTARSSDEDIDTDIKRLTEGLEVHLEDDRRYAKRVLSHMEPQVCEGYEYREGLMFTKARDGSVRSSEYTKAIIYMLSDGLYIVSRSFSLVSDEKRNSEVEIPYADISSVRIVRERASVAFGKKKFNARHARMVIEYGEGQVFSAPIHDDVNSDKRVETVSGLCKTSQNI